MSDEQYITNLRADVTSSLASYASCTEESASRIITLLRPEFSSEGALLYCLSDLISDSESSSYN